jgi:peptidoglycan-N-acetylglucosamine deacetylase
VNRAKPQLARRVWRRAQRIALDALGRTTFGTVTSVNTRQPLAAITFDGGPDAQWTPQVLDVLDAHGAKATFFVIGKYVEAHPDIVQRQHAGGHALGNHTYEHPSLPLVTQAQRRRELETCAAALAPYPQALQLFRAPYLDENLASRFSSWRQGYTAIACSLHASDWEDRDAEEIAQTLTEGAHPGDVIMLHDAVCDQRYRSRAAMIQALDRFLAARTDIRFVTIPELLSAGRPVRKMWLKRPNLARFASYERVI